LDLKVIDAEWIGVSFTPENDRTPRQKQLLSLSDMLVADLENAE
jgi:hypothetical protein